jgi:endonuclease/exonuclease/phosphatase family metal-dependent hydrolase
MIENLLLPLLAVLALPADPPAGPPAAEPIRVMSFNIRYGSAADGADHWCRRRELVADTIRRQAPHLLGVQEALAFQLRFLEDGFPRFERLGVGREADGGGEFSALFVDRERFEVLESGTFWLSPPPDVPGSRGWDAALPRICTWARLRDRADGREIRVLNTHFDHRGADARLESARLLAARAGAAPAVPTLVLGDLNAGEDSRPLDALRAAGLRDTFRVLHPDATRVGTFGGFRGLATGAKIDFVLASEGFEVRAAAIDRRSYSGRDASDHFAVTAELTVADRRDAAGWHPQPGGANIAP